MSDALCVGICMIDWDAGVCMGCGRTADEINGVPIPLAACRPAAKSARAAADCPGTLRVEGHTDNTGSAGINESLSRRRAEAVRAALIQRGVAPGRIIAAGYGSAQPLGDNATEDGRAMNRRIEIRIVGADE